jgi:hypothetical protein
VAPSTVPPPSCLRVLDDVQHLRELQHFDAARFLVELEAELSGTSESLSQLGAQLDGLHQVLLTIEQFTTKAMGIHLTHVLATEPAPPQLRTLLSSTIVAYDGDMKLLRRRFERSVSPSLLESIIAAAESVLGARKRLRDGTLALGRKLAAAHAPWLKRAAANRTLDEPERLRLRLARVDLQQIEEQPERLTLDRFEARLKKLPPPEEEIEVDDNEDAKAQRFSLLEID